MFKQKRSLFAAISLALLSLLSSAVTATAAGTKPAPDVPQNISQAVTQSYTAGEGVQIAMIVGLNPKQAGQVIPLTQAAISGMLGVTIAANDSTATLSPEAVTKQQVYVASTGRYSVLVSNQNGPIKTGDLITISALAGIGMKADASQSTILGRASTDFTGSGNVEGTVSLKDNTGKARSVSLSRITLSIGIAKNPAAGKATTYVPQVLASAAQAITGKEVSPAKLYIGFILLLGTTIVTGTVLYSGIRSGMIAVGRNPLTRSSIIKSLVQTVLAGLIIFIVGIVAVYLLLKL
jgi:hypothetical protein